MMVTDPMLDLFALSVCTEGFRYVHQHTPSKSCCTEQSLRSSHRNTAANGRTLRPSSATVTHLYRAIVALPSAWCCLFAAARMAPAPSSG